MNGLATVFLLLAGALIFSMIILGTAGNAMASGNSGEKAVMLSKAGDSLFIYDMSTLKLDRTIALSDPATSIALAPDNKELYLAIANSDVVQIVSTGDFKKTGDFRLSGSCGPIVFSPDGRRIYISVGNDVQVLDRRTHAVLKTIPTPQSKYGIDLLLSRDGSTLYASRYTTVYKINTADYASSIIDFSGIKPYWEPGTAYATRLALSADGRQLYVAFWDSRSGAIATANTETNTADGFFSVPKYRCDGIVFCEKPYGNYLYASDWDNAVVCVLNASTGNLVASINDARGPKLLAIDDSNDHIIVANEFDTVRVISTDNNSVTGTLDARVRETANSIVFIKRNSGFLSIFQDNPNLTIAAGALAISVIALIVSLFGILLIIARKNNKGK
jgi:DNA-binding beta-propeller fold protein YncE